jgi:hypothetical protein
MCENSCGTAGATTSATGSGAPQSPWVGETLLTISKLKRWSINYYIDTAQNAETASRDLARATGGLGEYYSEHETRTPTWLLAGDTRTTARLVGLSDRQRAGGEADAPAVARWLDDGIAPDGGHGRAFGKRGVHGFDLTFGTPKSVSLVRAWRADDVVSKAIAEAHTTALAMERHHVGDLHGSATRDETPVSILRETEQLVGELSAYQIVVGSRTRPADVIVGYAVQKSDIG